MKKFDIELKTALRHLAVEPVVDNVPHLFFYAIWSYILNKGASTLTESQASDKLKQFPDMEVVYFKLDKSNSPMPEILKDRKGLITETVSGITEVSDIIFIKSGARISENDLQPQK
jgi:hypothetical protein